MGRHAARVSWSQRLLSMLRIMWRLLRIMWRWGKKPLVILLSLAVTLATAYVFAIPWLDSRDKKWVACTVLFAEPYYSSSGTGRVRTSSKGVKVQTKECRAVFIFRNPDGEDLQERADRFVPGEVYEFRMGWHSQRDVKPGSFFSPTADDFRLVDDPERS